MWCLIKVGGFKKSCCEKILSSLARRQRETVSADNMVFKSRLYPICYPQIYTFFSIYSTPACQLTVSYFYVIISLPYTQVIAGNFNLWWSYAEIPDLSGVGMSAGLFSHREDNILGRLELVLFFTIQAKMLLIKKQVIAS